MSGLAICRGLYHLTPEGAKLKKADSYQPDQWTDGEEQ